MTRSNDNTQTRTTVGVRPKRLAVLLMTILFSSFIGRMVQAQPTVCVGDGKADDTDCLQQIINSGPNVTLPAGTSYRVSHSIMVTGPKSINGNGATFVTSLQIPVVTVEGSGVVLRGLNIASDTNLRAMGIFLDSGASHVELQNNRIVGKFLVGVSFGGPNEQDIRIVNNAIVPGLDGRIGFGILVNPARMLRGGGAPLHGLVITGNTISDVWGDAIEINSPPPFGASDVTITGNSLSAPNHPSPTAGFCIGMAGVTDVTISSNTLSDCKWQGIHLEHDTANALIKDNKIDKTIGPTGGQFTGRRNSSGILLLNSNHIKIYANKISNTYNAGVELAWNAVGVNTNVTIAGNTISNAGDYGIHVGGPAGRDMDVTVGAADGYGENQIINARTAPFAGCNSSIRGSDVRLGSCGQRQ